MILGNILDFLASRIGLDAQSVGLPTIESAVQERLRRSGANDLAAYARLLQTDAVEQDELIEASVVPETWFFRDQAPFDFLALNARKKWGEGSVSTPIRILSLPCSTGEEPYSIAMTLVDAGFDPSHFQIDAVDISRRALTHAQNGIYRTQDFRGKNLDVLTRHFTEIQPDRFGIKPRIKNTIRFTRGPLLPFPLTEGPKTFHAIFCRNLLIYLNQEWRQQAPQLFHHLLRPEGILFIGHAEATPTLNRYFLTARHPSAFAYYPITIHPPPSSPRTTPASESPVVSAPLLQDIQALLDHGDNVQARELCHRAIQRARSYAELYFLLGVAEDQLGHDEPARDALLKCLYLNPRHLNSLQRMKNLLERAGDHPAAERMAARIRRVQTKS